MEKMRASRFQRLIEIWDVTKDELKGKYVPPYYYTHILDMWHQLSQNNKSAKEYITHFDEFRIKCSTLGTESEAQILFRFRDDLRISKDETVSS